MGLSIIDSLSDADLAAIARNLPDEALARLVRAAEMPKNKKPGRPPGPARGVYGHRQAQVLAILAEPTKVAEVARRLEITIRNAAGAIGGLRRKGLVRSAGDHKWIAVAEVSQ